MFCLKLKVIVTGVVLMASPFLFSGSLFAAEVIRQFDVTANINKDGTVNIIEEITVNAEGNQIKRGIYRDIPTIYKDRMGNLVKVPFDLIAVKRNGIKEPFHISGQSNGLRIYIGDKDNFVAIGQHRYTIEYNVARVIGFFPTGDEFYWNVTGNGWIFPIEAVYIRLIFPADSKVIKFQGFTGIQGAQGRDYRVSQHGNISEARTTRHLDAYEGLTVVAAVPKGTIIPETYFQAVKFFLHDNQMWLVWISGTILCVIYLTLSWVRYGRDTKGTVIPRFEPPTNMSPDLMRYIYKQEYDNKSFIALIINAAAHKKINILEENENTVLEWSKDNSGGSFQNMNIIPSLFYNDSRIYLPKKKFFVTPKPSADVTEKLIDAKLLHKKQLSLDCEIYINQNLSFIVTASIFAAMACLWSYFLTQTEDQKFFLTVGSVIFYAFTLKFFGRIMPQYTFDGQLMYDYAAGLKMYIQTADKERYNTLYPEDITPEKFEKLLPYAFALDVEQEWCNYFSSLISAGLVPESQNNSMRLRRRFYDGNLSDLGNSLQDLSSSISSSSTPPSSTSGFGGSSGGGGGGGGGGGW